MIEESLLTEISISLGTRDKLMKIKRRLGLPNLEETIKYILGRCAFEGNL